MMRKLLILLAAISLVSCSNKEKAPDYVIPYNDMVNILVEIHITDGLLTSNKVRRKLAKNDTTNFYNAILNNYDYSRKDFDTSLYYYSKNINQYDLIYEEVLNRLSEIESTLKEKGGEYSDKE
ncbi:MAG: DUF4296 domain-containing protein [Bacteroidales bacterium]|nr:DUF4296 domain-containing protein [Bacteroidales bacterium]